MIDFGYMAKQVALRPEQLLADHVVDICSVSNCISDDFTDFIDLWLHNDFWCFDSLDLIRSICSAGDIAMTDLRWFYYRGHEVEFDGVHKQWNQYARESDLASTIVQPIAANRIGWDVVTYAMGSSPGCSPLSCNYLAAHIPVNRHCLIESLDDAINYLETGLFEHSEPGPYRIIEVNTIEWSQHDEPK